MKPPNTVQSLLPFVIVLAISAVVIWPVLHFGFVLHDDQHEILRNPYFQPFSLESLQRIWTEADFSRIYIPLNYTILGSLTAFSRWHSGLGEAAVPNPFIFHALGFFFHLVNTGLVLALLKRLAGQAGKSFQWGLILAGLAFGLHPAHVEGLARAGNLSVTLGGTWALLALFGWIKAAEKTLNTRLWQVAATGAFCFGLLTRPTVVALPLAAAIFMRICERVSWGHIVRVMWPAAAASFVYTVASFAMHPVSAAADGTRWYWRPLIAADSLMWYAGQALWPSRLSIDHGRTPAEILHGYSAWVAVIGIAALLYVVAKALRTSWRPAVAGVLFFLCMLLSVSGLVPAAFREGMSIVYDRHLYVPMLGISLVFVTILRRLPPEWGVALGVLVAGACAVRTRGYMTHWSDSFRLFQGVIQTNPKSWYGHGQLGTAYLMAGEPKVAIFHLQRALELNGRLVDVRINFGQALLDLGENAEAERVLRDAIAIDPNQDAAHNNLAVALIRREAWEEAEKAALRALQLAPGNLLARANLILVLGAQGKTLQAMDEAKILTTKAPGFGIGWRMVGQMLLDSGQVDAAMEALEKACSLEPARADWQGLLHQLKAEFGEDPKAVPPKQ